MGKIFAADARAKDQQPCSAETTARQRYDNAHRKQDINIPPVNARDKWTAYILWWLEQPLPQHCPGSPQSLEQLRAEHPALYQSLATLATIRTVQGTHLIEPLCVGTHVRACCCHRWGQHATFGISSRGFEGCTRPTPNVYTKVLDQMQHHGHRHKTDFNTCDTTLASWNELFLHAMQHCDKTSRSPTERDWRWRNNPRGWEGDMSNLGENESDEELDLTIGCTFTGEAAQWANDNTWLGPQDLHHQILRILVARWRADDPIKHPLHTGVIGDEQHDALLGQGHLEVGIPQHEQHIKYFPTRTLAQELRTVPDTAWSAGHHPAMFYQSRHIQAARLAQRSEGAPANYRNEQEQDDWQPYGALVNAAGKWFDREGGDETQSPMRWANGTLLRRTNGWLKGDEGSLGTWQMPQQDAQQNRETLMKLPPQLLTIIVEKVFESAWRWDTPDQKHFACVELVTKYNKVTKQWTKRYEGYPRAYFDNLFLAMRGVNALRPATATLLRDWYVEPVTMPLTFKQELEFKKSMDKAQGHPKGAGSLERQHQRGQEHGAFIQWPPTTATYATRKGSATTPEDSRPQLETHTQKLDPSRVTPYPLLIWKRRALFIVQDAQSTEQMFNDDTGRYEYPTGHEPGTMSLGPGNVMQNTPPEARRPKVVLTQYFEYKPEEVNDPRNKLLHGAYYGQYTGRYDYSDYTASPSENVEASPMVRPVRRRSPRDIANNPVSPELKQQECKARARHLDEFYKGKMNQVGPRSQCHWSGPPPLSATIATDGDADLDASIPAQGGCWYCPCEIRDRDFIRDTRDRMGEQCIEATSFIIRHHYVPPGEPHTPDVATRWTTKNTNGVPNAPLNEATAHAIYAVQCEHTQAPIHPSAYAELETALRTAEEHDNWQDDEWRNFDINCFTWPAVRPPYLPIQPIDQLLGAAIPPIALAGVWQYGHHGQAGEPRTIPTHSEQADGSAQATGEQDEGVEEMQGPYESDDDWLACNIDGWFKG